MTAILAQILLILATITGHTAHAAPNHAVSYCASATASRVGTHVVITQHVYVCK